jgi:oligoendopeptidase F
MFSTLPKTTDEFKTWPWAQIEPYYHDLSNRSLSSSNVEAWLSDWTRLAELLTETSNRLYVATTRDTTDQQAKKRLEDFLDHIYPPSQAADQALKEKLLASGLEPPGFEVPLRNLRAQSDLFREANLPLLTEEIKLATEYDQIIGAQTVEWEGKEVTLPQLRPIYADTDRAKREKAWRLEGQRWLADRGTLNELWVKFMNVRKQLAANAGRKDYRAYRWQQLLRFDYTFQDCYSFHRAIEEVVVPALGRLYERRRRRMGVDRLRPWDLEADPLGRPPLKPFETAAELEEKVAHIFERLDPALSQHYATMRREGLLDLDNRKGKAPGGYCTDFPAVRRPFIFMNAVGVHDDVQTLVHESGHAFHVFESSHLPYYQQHEVTSEIAEVASMGMEYLASGYLPEAEGGFYTQEDAARAQTQHIEFDIRFWPYMAVVDAFQQWVYENHAAATDPANCDARWSELWERYMVGVDWSGLEDAKVTGWQRKLHIYQVPFYYVEYGIAALGAVQVWNNSMKDRTKAVADYRKALSLGGTQPLPKLYQAAGARFAFDAPTLNMAVGLLDETLSRLDPD